MENFKKFNKEIKSGPDVKIVGKVSSESKEKIRQTVSGYFSEKHLSNLSNEQREKFRRMEYPKSADEKHAIDFANEITNRYMEKCEVKNYAVLPGNLHILPPDLYSECVGGMRNSLASTFHKYQTAIFNVSEVRGSRMCFWKTVFHEIMHLKSYLSVEVEGENGENNKIEAENEIPFATVRRGLIVESPKGRAEESGEYHTHFRGLNEAVVSYFERDFVREMLKLPDFKEEKEWLNSVGAAELRQKIAESEKVDMEDIYWISENIEDCAAFSYPKQRKVFNFLINEIQKRFPDKYKTLDDVAYKFLKSMFSGNLVDIAKLTEKTFGKLSFRVLGMMDSEKNSAINVLGYLRGAVLRTKKQKRAEIQVKNSKI